MQHHLTLEVEDGVTGVVLARGHYGMVRLYSPSILSLVLIHDHDSSLLELSVIVVLGLCQEERSLKIRRVPLHLCQGDTGGAAKQQKGPCIGTS